MVTRKGAELWFQPYYYFLILLQSFVPMKTSADAQYAKHLKVQLLRLKAGVDGGWGVVELRPHLQSNRGLLRGGQFEKTSRVAKTEALESDRPKICISACATSWLCELQGFTSPESQSHQLKMGQ